MKLLIGSNFEIFNAFITESQMIPSSLLQQSSNRRHFSANKAQQKVSLLRTQRYHTKISIKTVAEW